MLEIMYVGPTPADEECAQTVDADYAYRARAECKRYKAQLLKQFGDPPDGAFLAIHGQQHDFGTYYEVVIKYDPGMPAAVDYAFNVENNLPDKWDAEILARAS